MLKERENIIVSATEPTGKDREKVWLQKGKNLFNKNKANIISGYLSANTQKIYKNSTYIDKMLYIKCRPNTTYTISKKQSSRFSVCTADEIITTAEKNISNAITNNTSTSIIIISGANDNYLYVFYYTQGDNESSILDSIQIEQNSSVTSYETYIEPKIYVLNDNNVYEEFVSKQEEKIVLWEGSSLSSIIQLNDKPSNFKYFMVETSVNITVIVPTVINGSGAGGYTAIENSTYVKYETYLRIINLNNSTNTIQFSPSYLFRNNTYSKSANVTKIIGVK